MAQIAGLSELTRRCRGSRDIVILSLLEGCPTTAADIQLDYQFMTGEVLGRDSISKNLRRLMSSRLVAYASTGRDIPGFILRDPHKYYKLAPDGKELLDAFRLLMAPPPPKPKKGRRTKKG